MMELYVGNKSHVFEGYLGSRGVLPVHLYVSHCSADSKEVIDKSKYLQR
jgi:hypothetical protein